MLALRRQLSVGLRTPSAHAAIFSVLRRQAQLFGARSLSTEKMSAGEGLELLNKQRSARPLSPDLTIYKPQITSVLSGLHRITGCVLGGALYVYLLGYVFLPTLGLTVTPAGVAALVAGIPFALKFALKLTAATPFVFHSLNGIRHLFWDTAHGLSIPAVYKTGYAVVALTAIGSLALALL